jgi:H-type lectin domain
MKRFSSGRVGVEQGSTVLFADFQTGGPMWTGQGLREARTTVPFKERFREAPAVMAGLSLWDFDQGTNVRAEIATEKVTAKGFVLVFKTWGDTRVARARADWIAIGAVRDEDDWDVD